jgi:hypothetical protein
VYLKLAFVEGLDEFIENAAADSAVESVLKALSLNQKLDNSLNLRDIPVDDLL